MTTWLTILITIVVVVVGIERLANAHGLRRGSTGRGGGGSGAFGELVDVFQPTHAQLTMELDRQRLDIVQSPSTDPEHGIDLDAGIVTYVPRGPSPEGEPTAR
jgi:hypothetical protein